MKVKELVDKLNGIDLNSEVLIYCEDENLPDSSDLVHVMEIQEISESNAEKSRDDNGIARVTFGQGESLSKMAVIQVTFDV